MRTERATPQMQLRALLVVTLAAAAALAPTKASAYCRTTTVAVPADYSPRGGECWTQGVSLWWRSACVGFSLQRDGSTQVPLETATRGVEQAFRRWASATCGADGARVSIDFRNLGPVECGNVQYKPYGNTNVIVFRDDAWPHPGAKNTLALTTVTFDPQTGEIYDADIEINTSDQTVTVTDPVPPNGYDYLSIVTHEAGHFLGLAHSAQEDATMYARYLPGRTNMRDLAKDDAEGACAIYPPDGTRNVDPSVDPSGVIQGGRCDATPRRGFLPTCDAPEKDKCAVGVGPGLPQSVGLGAFGAAAAAAALLFRRRRARR
jgi:hypothetical protein